MLQDSKNAAERAKRLSEWTSWLELFQQQSDQSFTYIKNAAELLNNIYWDLVNRYLKQVLAKTGEDEEGMIHVYKIIAASEIAVMMTEPIVIQNPKPEAEKWEAAKFAYFVSMQIFENWRCEEASIELEQPVIEKLAFYQEPISKTDIYPTSFAREHVEWLYHLNVTVEKPLLINAQCWRMFYIACMAVSKKGELNFNLPANES